ncbi:SAP domain-containing ribonucleoprotein-like isoform X3 [Salvelinus fontinalis]|nr:SAP domain-containing ribonucleoprotein-like isoform X3 [Salvelinus fontinalis]
MGLNEDDVLGEEPEGLTKEDAITEDNDKKPIVSEETAEKKVVKITPPASVDERVQKRAERFNVPASADDKKAIHAARFGLPPAAPPTSTPGVTVNKSTAVSVEQLKKVSRAIWRERFFSFQEAPATLFLAAKVEEQPRKLEHVIKVTHACLNPQDPSPDVRSDVVPHQLVFSRCAVYKHT